VSDSQCAYCGNLISWRKRSDARFCSTKCRVAHHRARTGQFREKQSFPAAFPTNLRTLFGPFVNAYETQWASAVICENCDAYTTSGYKIENRRDRTSRRYCRRCWDQLVRDRWLALNRRRARNT
jgi:hypothetical protein